MAHGSMSSVYRASSSESTSLHSAFRDSFVVKVYDNTSALRQFQRELAFLNIVRDHPNVVALVDSREGSQCALVTPFYGDEDLKAFVTSRSGLDEVAAVGIMEDLLSATQHVHARGVLHGDIAPEKVLVCEDGRVVLVDFDMACHLHNVPHLQRPHGGTPGYMSPETILRNPLRPPSDLFSVASVCISCSGHCIHSTVTGIQTMCRKFCARQ
eukprot:TRINITY_DN29934_c0_g1_i1.p1 TRINITY_DN29934_c0_g1~~TRINITY_DN29934_c0_g1_i1.p1  ORF type:complete len:232 (-),score=18.92 TRINITY_DN29934_c0_g1_i1:748-1383(-)